ncbi:uncharacterized protein LOC124977661 isoform X2 [Sciurus carolinensis]|uniref:uncharacterized protein LOC124977661 isoform X2 n=1 Tax=Sciurus carolinensis TaxID=30640 RepID=UPI001FB26020|nr:uncharacterized protein LOC124977661 isoform X2 [Sciurus carolinensis]
MNGEGKADRWKLRPTRWQAPRFGEEGELVDGWLKKCAYGLGKCRKACKADERKKEKCGRSLSCCISSTKAKLSHSPKKNNGTESCKQQPKMIASASQGEGPGKNST